MDLGLWSLNDFQALNHARLHRHCEVDSLRHYGRGLVYIELTILANYFHFMVAKELRIIRL